MHLPIKRFPLGLAPLMLACLLWGLGACSAQGRANQRVNTAASLMVEPERDMKQAEQVLYEALEIDPDNPYALFNLGLLRKHQGRFGEARALFERLRRMGSQTKPANRPLRRQPLTMSEYAALELKSLPPAPDEPATRPTTQATTNPD
jgi:tetratricopeptide (TPR) repeat protein